MIHKPSYRDKQIELANRRWGIGGLEETLRRVSRDIAPFQVQLKIVSKTPGTRLIKFPTWKIIMLTCGHNPDQRAYITLPRLHFNETTGSFKPVFVAGFDAVAYPEPNFIMIVDTLIEYSKPYAL